MIGAPIPQDMIRHHRSRSHGSLFLTYGFNFPLNIRWDEVICPSSLKKYITESYMAITLPCTTFTRIKTQESYSTIARQSAITKPLGACDNNKRASLSERQTVVVSGVRV